MEATQKQYYKYCIVPMCCNTTYKTPKKLFIRVPQDKKRRLKWLKACRRNDKDISKKTTAHVCEDHFNLEEDMDNYVKYKLMGGQKKMKTNVVPHRFDCQPDRKMYCDQNDHITLSKLESPIEVHKGKPEILDISIFLKKECDENVDVQYIKEEGNLDVEFVNQLQTELIIDNIKVEFNENELSAEVKVEPTVLDDNSGVAERKEVNLDVKCVNQLQTELIIDDIKLERNESELSAEVKDEPKVLDNNIGVAETIEKGIDAPVVWCGSKVGRNDRNLEHPKQYACEICLKKLASNRNLRRHQQIHTGEKCFECDICHKKYRDKYHCDAHRRIHTGEASFKCPLCYRGFTDNTKLNIHVKSHENKVVKCEFCAKRFLNNARFLEHWNTHTGEKPFECKVCLKQFVFKRYLIRHQYIHLGGKRFECDVCHKKFSEKYNCEMHRITHTKEAVFKCQICFKKFKSHTTLNMHMKSHENNLLQCEFCPKKFPNNSRLQAHLRTHTGEKPFKCTVEFCPKKFPNNSRLQVHLRTHTGEKPFKCTVCSKEFISQMILNKHRYLHYQEKRFECDICHKKFNENYQCVVHRRTHTGETPYKCQICSKGFIENYILKRHMKLHNSKERILCLEVSK